MVFVERAELRSKSDGVVGNCQPAKDEEQNDEVLNGILLQNNDFDNIVYFDQFI